MKKRRCYICKRYIEVRTEGHEFVIDPKTERAKHNHKECREMFDEIQGQTVTI